MTGVNFQFVERYMDFRYCGKSRIERFVDRIEIMEADECWPWNGARSRTGYGRTNSPFNSGTIGAHRLSWILDRRRLPKPDLVIAHKCHNRACVNPAHLEEVTQGKNMADAVALGSFQGENHGRARLTEQDIYKIRASQKSENQLARDYGMSPSHIHRIRARECWKHLPDNPLHS